ncbi:MAG: GDP-mannose 4,6-dehydratase, partial [Eubacterium sp.]|nr:GDP-mannose 4,6-dehydratase [Eubacterium sp.]
MERNTAERQMLDFYRNKKVLVTGHTGFKGTWLTRMLLLSGAQVQGYSLEPPTRPNLYSMAGLSRFMESGQLRSEIGDIRDFGRLQKIFHDFRPEIVFHLAAQPIVRESYRNPRETYETNVMGTVNVLECIRTEDSVRSVLNVTTDKVYRNREWVWGYRETDPLDGFDPYSNSKSCSELATHSY